MTCKKERILVIDDSVTMRRIVTKVLRELGFTEVDEADNGKEALVMLQAGSYDLAIADWNMPLMTGIELLKAVRADERLKHIPFIMLTAEGQKHNILEAVKADVSQYVMKPFTADLLARKITRALAAGR
ncbi:MAG: response regulator [Thermodesulfobacteriota bacterium]